mgnify:FL=1
MSRSSLNSGFLSYDTLEKLGVLDAERRNIRIHSTAVIVNFDEIQFGENVRIDAYVVLSCRDLILGNYVHIASGCGFFGTAPIRMGDFSTTSAQVLVYSSTDDYSGKYMTNQTIPSEFTNVQHAAVLIERHCIIGAHSTILPGSALGEGAAVGSAALVNGPLPPWTISVGTPAKPIKSRARNALDIEVAMLSKE